MKQYIHKISYPKCPYCGSEETAELIYGHFSNRHSIWEMIRQGRRVVFGRCLIPPVLDQWSCTKCGKSFSDDSVNHKTLEQNGHDYYVRVVININSIKHSNVSYDLNMISKELGVWVDTDERFTCQGFNLNHDQYNMLKQTLRQMKYEYENIFEEQTYMDFDRNVKSHFSVALISDDGYPLVTQYGVSGDSTLIRILTSFTLSYKESGELI